MKHFSKSLISFILIFCMFLSPLSSVLTVEAEEEAEAATASGLPAAGYTTGITLPDNRIYGTFYFSQGKDAPASFEYSDAYFNDSSTYYSGDLAVILQCVVMSSFNAIEGRTTDYSHKYKNLENLLTQMGYSDFYHNDFYEIKPQTDSMGVGIAVKYVPLSDGTIQPIIGVACRSGNYEMEWVGNVTIGSYGDAEGFGKARDIVIDNLITYLSEHRSSLIGENIRSPKMWVCGHSRGSATANLTGNYLDCALLHEGDNSDTMLTLTSLLDDLGMKFEDLYVYGFEVPQGMSESSALKASNTDNIWCIVDPTDPVPLVAPSAMGFYRAGRDVDPTEGVTYQEFLNQMETIDPGMAKEWANMKMRGKFVAKEYSFYSLYKYIADDCNDASSSAVGDTFAEFEYNLVNEWLVPCMARAAQEFEATEDMSAREAYGKVFQESIAILTRVLMGSSTKDKNTFMDEVKNTVNENLSVWRLVCLFSAAAEFTVGSGWTTAPFEGALLPLVENVLDDLMENDKVTAIVSVSELATIKECSAYMTAFLANLLLYDRLNNMQYIATALYYMDELFAPHNAEYILAYLRAQNAYNNYTRQQLTVTPKTGETLDNIKVEIYREENVSPYNRYLVATLTKDGLTVTPGEELYWTGSAQYTESQITVLCADKNWSYYDFCYEISLIDSTEVYNNVKINYDYLDKGTKHKSTTQSFENTVIPMLYGDVLQVRPIEDSLEASLTKTIQLTPVFVNKYHQTIAEGSISITVDGKEQSLDSISVTAANLLTVNAPDDTVFYRAEIPYRDLNGRTFSDPEMGRYFTKAVDSVMTWDYNMCSSVLYLVCKERMQTGSVYAEAVYQHLKQQTGRTLINEAASEVTLQMYNETRNTLVTVDCSGFLNALPGEYVRVTVDENTIPADAVFEEWDIGRSQLEDVEIDGMTIRFRMPSTGVELTAMFASDLSNKITLTFTGRWANPSGTLPTDLSPAWKLRYIDSDYIDISYKNAANYYPVKHIYALNGKSGGKAWIEAPEYASDTCDDKVFDHWEAYETDTGLPWTETNAIVTVYSSTTGSYEIQNVCPNGLKEKVLVLTNINKSITLVPVYETAKYTLTVKYSTRGIEKYELAAGETIELTDRCSAGHIHDYWLGSYNPLTETTDAYGQITRSEGDTVSECVVNSDSSATFVYTMPKGNAYVTAYEKTGTYTLTLADTGLKTASGETSFAYGEEVNLIPDYIPEGCRLNGVKILDGGLLDSSFTVFRNDDGEVIRIRFKMPGTDVELASVLQNATPYTLKIINATSAYTDRDASPKADTSDNCYIAYEDNSFRLSANNVPDGYYVKEWKVTEGSVELLPFSETENLLLMPAENITVEAVIAKIQPITEVTLDFTGEFAGLRTPPSAVFCEGEGIKNAAVAAVWTNEHAYWESPAIFGSDYCYQCTLSPERGYYFDSSTAVIWNGILCTVDIQADGTAVVTGTFRTSPAEITSVYGLRGATVFAGSSEEDAIRALPQVAIVSVNNGEQTGYPIISWDINSLTTLNGEPAEYSSASAFEKQEYYIYGTIQVDTITGDYTDFADGGLVFADGVSGTVKTKLTVMPSESIATPYVSGANKPGTYTSIPESGLSVNLSCDTENTAIYYLVDVTGQKPTEAELLENGQIYNPEQGITLKGQANAHTVIAIWAVSCGTGTLEGKLGNIVEFEYIFNLKSTKHTLTVINGTASGLYYENALIGISAEEPDENATFTGFNTTDMDLIIETQGLNGSFIMPEQDISVIASYSVDRVNIAIVLPTPGQDLSDDIRISADTPAAVGISPVNADSDTKIIYYTEDFVPVIGDADYNTRYVVKFTLNSNQISGYGFTASTTVYVNGSLAESELNADGTISVTYTFPKTVQEPKKLFVFGGTVYDADSGEELIASEPNVYLVYPQQHLRIQADSLLGYVFSEWEATPYEQPFLVFASVTPLLASSSVTAISAEPSAQSDSFEFIVPDMDMILEAQFLEVISEAELTLTPAKRDEALDSTAETETKGLNSTEYEVQWSIDGQCVSGKAGIGIYLADIRIQCEDGKIFDENLKVTINGYACNVRLSEDFTQAALAIPYSTEGALIREITQPEAIINVPAHTPLGADDSESLTDTIKAMLPTETTIRIDGETVTARIRWNLSSVSGYDPSSGNQQTFSVYGELEPIYEGTSFDENTTFWSPDLPNEIEISVTVNAESQTPQTGDSATSLLCFLLIIATLWFMMIFVKKQRKAIYSKF